MIVWTIDFKLQYIQRHTIKAVRTLSSTVCAKELYYSLSAVTAKCISLSKESVRENIIV